MVICHVAKCNQEGAQCMSLSGRKSCRTASLDAQGLMCESECDKPAKSDSRRANWNFVGFKVGLNFVGPNLHSIRSSHMWKNILLYHSKESIIFQSITLGQKMKRNINSFNGIPRCCYNIVVQHLPKVWVRLDGTAKTFCPVSIMFCFK